MSGYASGAIIDGVLAADIAAFNEKSDGYLRNIFLNKKTGEYKRYGLRSKILFTPSDWSKFTLTLAQGQTTDNKVRNYNANTQLGPAQATFRPGGLAPSDRGLVSANLPTWFKLTSHSVSLTSEFDLGFADLKSYTGWQYHAAFNNLDRDASNLDIIYSASRVKYRTGQQEFDLSSKPGSKLSWVAGAFFLRDTTYNRETYQKNGAVPVTPNYVYGVTSRSYAGYFDATYQFTEQLFLTGGIRYSHEKLTDYWIDYPGVYGSAPAIYTIPVNSGVTFSSTTPRAVLRYQIDPGTNVYASFSKGFKAGLVNPSAKSTLTIEPEKITAYEIGYKTARSGMRFNASAFMYDYKNLQVSSFTGVSSIITNASNSKIYGVEAQFSGNLTDQLTANLAAAYVHSRYKDFTTAPAFAQNRTTGAFANVVAIASGLQMQRSPIFTASAGLDYKVPLSSGSLTFSGNGYYTSTIYFDPSHQFSQKGYALLGARAVYTTTDGHYSAALYVDNITDTKYLNQVLGGPAVVQQTYGDPRTFGASITLHY